MQPIFDLCNLVKSSYSWAISFDHGATCPKADETNDLVAFPGSQVACG